ncbi:19577_t:CDS:2 [Funneliformis geosporum]|uniref:19425_t:CDS:1 n=1 Tax=Funneliformis geosporum TaxID=1117311 RepID=A0A9W4SJ72_9GLOM|nr:19577_t:CDS:2 [Funneliformis geosporum]CAI2170281.1 19425_t:CDS:2 [Funneliformis geosporum]
MWISAKLLYVIPILFLLSLFGSPFFDSETIPLPLPKLHGKFLHITDFHPDPHYVSNVTARSRCHEHFKSTKKPKHMKRGISGPWGAPATVCDSPMSLIDATFEWLEKNWKNKLDFIVWTGDNARHDNDDIIPRTPEEMFRLNRMITEKFLETFGDPQLRSRKKAPHFIPIVPSIGNNDIHPNNIVLPGPNDLLTTLHDIWYPFIPQKQHKTFLKGGYFYTEVIPGKLIVVSINTLYFYKANTAVNGCKAKDQPGTIHLRWLNDVLRMANKRGLKVYLTEREGLNISQEDQGAVETKVYNIDKYMNKLLKHYRKIPLTREVEKEYAVININPSVIPTFFPALRIFDYNITELANEDHEVNSTKKSKKDSPSQVNTFLTPLGYTQYFINLTHANLYPNITPEYIIEYTTWNEYHMNDLTVPSWIQLARRIVNRGFRSSLWKKFQEHLMVGTRSLIRQKNKRSYRNSDSDDRVKGPEDYIVSELSF